MDQEGTGGARVPHVIVLGAMDSRTVQAAMRPALERSRTQGAAQAPRCIVIAPTPAAVLMAADEARRVLGAACRVVPVTSVTRARRVVGSGPLSVVVGTPGDIRALRKSADLALDELAAVVLLGLDHLLDGEAALVADARDAIDALLADVPKTVMRSVSASQETPTVQAFQQQHLPKARQITPHVTATPVEGVTVPQYLIVSPLQRAAMVRAVLDERDPPSVAIVAAGEVAQAEAHDMLASLGLPVDGQTVQVVERAPNGHTAALIGWGVPADAAALQAAMSGAPVFAVFLAATDDIVHLQTISGNSAQPFVLRSSSARARGEASALVRGVRETITSAQGLSAGDYALLAPLLETHDPMEIAAAAVRQLAVTQRQLREAQEALTHRRVTVLSQVVSAPPVEEQAAATSGDAAATAPVAQHEPRETREPREMRETRDTREPRGERVAFDRRSDDRGDRGGDRGGRFSRDERPRGGKSLGDRPRGGRSFGDRERGGKSFGDRPRGGKPFGDRPRGERSFGSDRPRGDRSFGDRPRGDKPFGDRPRGERSFGGDRPRGERSFGGDRARGDRPFNDRPREGDRERRAFSDRSPRDRTEQRGEWAERGERLSRSKRPRRGEE